MWKVNSRHGQCWEVIYLLKSVTHSMFMHGNCVTEIYIRRRYVYTSVYLYRI